MIVGYLFPHQYTCDGGGCETEYVWGTCVDWNPGYLQHRGSLAEVESLNTNRDLIRVYSDSYNKCCGEFPENIETCDCLVLLLSNRLPERCEK